jgi:hypothetical protein
MERHWRPLIEDRTRLVSLALAVTGLVLLAGAFLGAGRSEFLVSDLAYIGTGGLGGIACLGLAGAVQVAARSARRCEELDRIGASLSGPTLSGAPLPGR